MKHNQTPAIDISACFAEAWKGFKGWWIPLCLVTSILFLSDWLPKLVIKEFDEARIIESYENEFEIFSKRIKSGYNPVNAVSRLAGNISELNSRPQAQTLFIKIMIFFGIFLLIICALNVIIILMSKFSVFQDKEKLRNYAGKPFKLTPVYMLISLIRIIPFFFFVIPGVFIYVKLYFTDFIITEESANPFSAMEKSWKMTDGIFFPTLMIFLLSFGIDVISFITVIGFIPGTSFKFTLRASLYKQALARMACQKVENSKV